MQRTTAGGGWRGAVVARDMGGYAAGGVALVAGGTTGKAAANKNKNNNKNVVVLRLAVVVLVLVVLVHILIPLIQAIYFGWLSSNCVAGNPTRSPPTWHADSNNCINPTSHRHN